MDLVANNFFKIVNTNLEHPVCEKNWGKQINNSENQLF